MTALTEANEFHHPAAIAGDELPFAAEPATLSVLDRKWREHLYEMDYLRGYGQRDPLIEPGSQGP